MWPKLGLNPQQWDDEGLRTLKISLLYHLATGAASKLLVTMLLHQPVPNLNCPVDVTSQTMPFQCNQIKSYCFALACSSLSGSNLCNKALKKSLVSGFSTDLFKFDKTASFFSLWAKKILFADRLLLSVGKKYELIADRLKKSSELPKAPEINVLVCFCVIHNWHLSQLMRLWHFSSSINSFFKHACAAIQWG